MATETADAPAAILPVRSFATGPVLGIAAAATVLLLAFASRYGYHRDELYFLEASHHLAFGYVDQPPIAVLGAALDRVVFGNSLLGLRLIPALLVGACIIITGAMAREFGGGRFAQGFAALCVAGGAILAVGSLEGPTVYDVALWSLVSFLVVRILRTGDQRLWLLVGLAVGIGVEAKQTVPLLLAGLAIGFLVNGQRAIFRSRWLWAGAAIALMGLAPNLAWQAAHGWPSAEMNSHLRAEHSGLGAAITLPFLSITAVGIAVAPIWMAGWWGLWRDSNARRFRAFAVAFAIAFVFVWIVIPDRFYYAFGLYPVLIAYGSLITAQVVTGERGFFRRSPQRRVLWRSPRSAAGIVVASGVVSLPLLLPVLPASTLATLNLQKVNYNLGEEIGWPEYTREVAAVWDSLAPSARANAVIVTSNYGEAGAIDRFGSGVGLPNAYSGHNSYWWWGPPRPTSGTAVAIGFDRSDLTPYFGTVRLAARVHNNAGVANDEEGAPIWVCTDQVAPWPQIWPRFKDYG